MKVKVTKTMAKALNKALQDQSSIQEFIFDSCDKDAYIHFFNVDYALNNEQDFDYITNKFKYIIVRYKDECYSFDNYIGSYDLIKCFNRSDHTYNGFINAVFDAYEI